MSHILCHPQRVGFLAAHLAVSVDADLYAATEAANAIAAS
jgi:hypothetical protein